MSFLPAEPSAVSVEVQSFDASHPMLRMPTHAHVFFELLLCVEGDGRLVVGDREIVVRPRSVVALAPGVEHDCRRLDTAGGWSIIFLSDGAASGADAGFAIDARIPKEMPFDVFRPAALATPIPIVLGEDAFETALTLVASMERELVVRSEGYDVMVRSALTMLLVLIGRVAASVGGDASADAVRSARAFLARVFAEIDEHYAEGGSLRETARRLDVQPGYLTTRVRRLTGKTYGAWVIERRMIEARRLLGSTDFDLAEIAERLGYAESESFVRRFGKHHAMTPASWRRVARSERTAASSFVESRSIGA